MRLPFCYFGAGNFLFFSILIICPEKICREWVQLRKYLTCVVCMSILLRSCRSESTHESQTFAGK